MVQAVVVIPECGVYFKLKRTLPMRAAPNGISVRASQTIASTGVITGVVRGF